METRQGRSCQKVRPDIVNLLATARQHESWRKRHAWMIDHLFAPGDFNSAGGWPPNRSVEHTERGTIVGNKFDDRKLGLFQDASFLAYFQDSKPTASGILCILEPQPFVPISSMCKKQNSSFSQQFRI